VKENAEFVLGILNDGKLEIISAYNPQLRFACPVETTDPRIAFVSFH